MRSVWQSPKNWWAPEASSLAGSARTEKLFRSRQECRRPSVWMGDSKELHNSDLVWGAAAGGCSLWRKTTGLYTCLVGWLTLGAFLKTSPEATGTSGWGAASAVGVHIPTATWSLRDPKYAWEWTTWGISECTVYTDIGINNKSLIILVLTA